MARSVASSNVLHCSLAKREVPDICSLISAILFSSVSGKGNKKEKYF
jgi:hypothetical protein